MARSDDPTLLDELGLARIAAHRAAAEIAERWRTGARVRFKGPIDPVTEADLAAERIIVDLIRARFPDDRILAEELGASGSADSGRRWLVDPLDGTTNFSHRLPHFCVSIASADAQGPRVGVIVEPLRGLTFEAVRGAAPGSTTGRSGSPRPTGWIARSSRPVSLTATEHWT